MADANIFIKTLTDQIKEYGDIQSQRAKIQSDLLVNSMKAKQNFFFKQQEQAAKEGRINQARQATQAKINEMRTDQAPVTPYGDPEGGGSNYPGGQVESAGVGQTRPIRPFRDTPTQRAGLTKEGLPEINKPLDRKSFIYQRIQDKKNMKELLESRGDPRAANYELSKAEKAFEKKYLGMKEKEDEEELLFPEDGAGGFQETASPEALIEPRATGLGRIGRGAAYKEATAAYGGEKADVIIGKIQDLQKAGKSFAEIRKLMEEEGINAELFLKFYR